MYIWAEGARYEGEYKEDKKNGRGVQTWPSGARYFFHKMRIDVFFRIRGASGAHAPLKIGALSLRRYEGEYVDSMQTGYGLMTWADGRRYEGYCSPWRLS